MNYAKIRNYDIANGEGVRVSLFVSGCTNHCPGCFNPEQQNFDYGEIFTLDTFHKVIDLVQNPVISGLSILGGDPLCQNTEDLATLSSICDAVHSFNKNVWLWTGFVWEDIYTPQVSIRASAQQNLLEHCDIVVDGPFKQELFSRALNWRGSSNQRVINVRKTLSDGKICIYGE